MILLHMPYEERYYKFTINGFQQGKSPFLGKRLCATAEAAAFFPTYGSHINKLPFGSHLTFFSFLVQYKFFLLRLLIFVIVKLKWFVSCIKLTRQKVSRKVRFLLVNSYYNILWLFDNTYLYWVTNSLLLPLIKCNLILVSQTYWMYHQFYLRTAKQSLHGSITLCYDTNCRHP